MQREKQKPAPKNLLGVGEYGCWECTLLPVQMESGDFTECEKIWVFARTLGEIAENIHGVESALFLGKATCIADPTTPGVLEASRELLGAVAESAIINHPPKKACPFCAATAAVEDYKHPEGVAGDVNVVACPKCHLLINPARLIEVKA